MMAQSAWCGCHSQTVGAASVVARTVMPIEAEFKVILDDTLGTLAQLGAVLGDAGVNLEAIQGTATKGKGVIQFVANDPGQAAHALEAAHIAYTKREVIVVRVLDEPGTFGDVALVMAKAGINIDSVYVTTRGHIVLGVDDIVGATQVAGGMAVMAVE
jgi:hypothetical protein